MFRFNGRSIKLVVELRFSRLLAAWTSLICSHLSSSGPSNSALPHPAAGAAGVSVSNQRQTRHAMNLMDAALLLNRRRVARCVIRAAGLAAPPSEARVRGRRHDPCPIESWEVSPPRRNEPQRRRITCWPLGRLRPSITRGDQRREIRQRARRRIELPGRGDTARTLQTI